MRTVSIEYFRMWDDNTWDTEFINIPDTTPEDKLDEAVREAAAKIKWTDRVPCIVGHYSGPHHAENGLLIRYICPYCGEDWEEEYDCACDGVCGECGCKNISPVQSRDLDGEWTTEQESKWVEALK